MSNEGIRLSQTDSLRVRIEKAFQYAGFANPNRLGTVDQFYYIFSEYQRLDAQALQSLGKESGND